MSGIEKRLELLEAQAARLPDDDDGFHLDVLFNMELRYLIHLLGERNSIGPDALSPEEREDLNQMLALAYGNLSREQVPCRGEFKTNFKVNGHPMEFLPCAGCGYKHPAPERLPEVPPFEQWAHVLPESIRDPRNLYHLNFFIRHPTGQIVPYLVIDERGIMVHGSSRSKT